MINKPRDRKSQFPAAGADNRLCATGLRRKKRGQFTVFLDCLNLPQTEGPASAPQLAWPVGVPSSQRRRPVDVSRIRAARICAARIRVHQQG